MAYFALLTAFLVALLLWSEGRADPLGRAVFKLMASTSFVGCALAAGATTSSYGRWILLALALSWFGDAFLVSRRKTWFLAGLVSFLLAHLAFMGAFIAVGVRWRTAGVAVVVLIAVGAGVARWLLPKVESRMRPPVVAYLVAITAMVALGAGAFSERLPGLLVAPMMFFVSDLAVARDRFVEPSFVNRLLGLPLYYGAQVLFAVSSQLLS